MPRKTKMNSITSAEKTALINKNNLRLKDDFLLYLKSVQRSEGTISGYDNDLLIVFTYIMESLGNKDFQKLTKRDIISIQNWLLLNGNSSARIRRIKSAISSLSNYCENILADDDPDFDGYRSIVRKIEDPPLQPVREKTVLNEDDIESILQKLVENGKHEMACFVALGAFSGRRKSELCRFKLSDFASDRLVCGGSLYKSAPILTKGGKMLECYTLAKKFDPYLSLWKDEMERLDIHSEWLFPHKQDPSSHIEASTVNGWAETISSMVGCDFYFHALRHSYCSYLIRSGVPDSVIVDIVGWSSSEMLKIYNDNPKDDRLSMYFDGDGIKNVEKKGLEDL